MHWNVKVTNEKVLIPTTARTEAGYYLETEPVEVVAKSDSEGFTEALVRVIAKGNPRVPTPSREVLNRPILPNYAGLRSYHAFEKRTESWAVSERGGRFLVEYLPRARDGKGWVSHPDHIEFLPMGGTSIDAAHRLVNRIQAHDVAPRGRLALLEDPRVQAYQLAVSKRTNGDPHLYVGTRAEGHEPLDLLREVLDDWRLADAIVQQNFELKWMNYDRTLLNRLRHEGKRGSFTKLGYFLKASPVRFAVFRAFLTWTLTGQGPSEMAAAPPAGIEEADSIAGGMLEVLCGTEETRFRGKGPREFEFWRMSPDFLNHGEELQTTGGEPVFFDSLGSNYAWLAGGPGLWFVLLLSCYPCPRPFVSPDGFHS